MSQVFISWIKTFIYFIAPSIQITLLLLTTFALENCLAQVVFTMMRHCLQRNKTKHWQIKDGCLLTIAQNKVKDRNASITMASVTFHSELSSTTTGTLFPLNLLWLFLFHFQKHCHKKNPQSYYFESNHGIVFEDILMKQKRGHSVTGARSHATPSFTLLHHTYHGVLPSGGFLFWLFQTTNNLDRLGTLDTSVMTRKRLSTLS